MLSLVHVSYRHAGATRDSLVDVSLDLPEGAITGLTGPSEAGLSSLCLVLAGLAPSVVGGRLAGRVLLDGVDVSDPTRRLREAVAVGLSSPSAQLSGVAESVYEEVAFGPQNLGVARGEILDRVDEALERLGIEALAPRDPRNLSGGEQQLVVLAGLLAMRPRHLVLDGPLAQLDAHAARRVLQALAAAVAAGTGVLLAEPRTDVLATACARIVVMHGGAIRAVGPTDAVLSDPAIVALGVEEPPVLRSRRLLAEAGIDMVLLEQP